MGGFAKVSAAELGAVAIKEVMNRANVEPKDVNEVIMGQVSNKNTYLTELLLRNWFYNVFSFNRKTKRL